jgi:hypothetical protein
VFYVQLISVRHGNGCFFLTSHFLYVFDEMAVLQRMSAETDNGQKLWRTPDDVISADILDMCKPSLFTVANESRRTDRCIDKVG